jgi:hypothetical protein
MKTKTEKAYSSTAALWCLGRLVRNLIAKGYSEKQIKTKIQLIKNLDWTDRQLQELALRGSERERRLRLLRHLRIAIS